PAMALVLSVRLPRVHSGSALGARQRWLVALLTLLSLAPYLLAWYGLGHVFPTLAQEPMLALGASYVVGWAAGVVVFVTPGGLGVREAVFMLVSPPVAREALALLAIFARVWHLFADSMAWLLGSFVRAFWRKVGTT